MFPPGARIATGQQLPADQLDVFAVDSGGELWAFWVVDGGNWSNGPMIVDGVRVGNVFLSGGPLTAATQAYDDWYNLSVTGVDATGAVQAFRVAWTVKYHWKGWYRWAQGLGYDLPPGASIQDSSTIESIAGKLFVVNNAGTLLAIAPPYPEGTEVSDWAHFQPGAPLALGVQMDSQGNPQLDVFLVNSEGDGYGSLTEFCRPVGATPDRNPWPGGAFPTYNLPPAAPVATGYQHQGSQLDVFVVDNTGQLQVWWTNDVPFSQGPMPNGGNLPPGAYVAAALQPGGDDQLDVFAVDNDGHLQVWWVSGIGDWAHGPMPGGGNLPPGAPIATGYQNGGSQLDVFVVDYDGHLQVFWVSDGGSWAHGPMPEPPTVVIPDWGSQETMYLGGVSATGPIPSAAQLGLQIQQTLVPNDGQGSAGDIVWMTPPAGTTVPTGSTVSVGIWDRGPND